MEFRGIHVKQELDDGIESKTCKGDAIKLVGIKENCEKVCLGRDPTS